MSEAENARWYVVHTYSGYENKVKADIEKTKENRNLQDQIIEVVVPVEDATEIKNGKPKSIERKILPGYVLINMIMNDVTWYKRCHRICWIRSKKACSAHRGRTEQSVSDFR